MSDKLRDSLLIGAIAAMLAIGVASFVFYPRGGQHLEQPENKPQTPIQGDLISTHRVGERG